VSTEYFDEHSHIDVHHGRMALKRLIIPMIEQFGDKIIPDLIRGFEEFKLLQDIADEELYAHINLEKKSLPTVRVRNVISTVVGENNRCVPLLKLSRHVELSQ
jgi:hypothetical protein